LLARGAGRRGEFAVRMALGAARGRIVRQLITESLVLAALGGVAGVALAWIGVKGLVAISPADLPRLGAIQVDGTVLAFALGVTTVVGVLFGALPAWQASGATIHDSIRAGARAVVGSDRWTRATVVVSEVALASVLLVGAGLLVRSMDRLLAISPGFDPANVLTMQVQAGAGGLQSDTLIRRFFDDALANVRTLPGVESAAFTSQLPLSGDFDGYGVRIQSRVADDPANGTDAFRYAVSDGYFETMRIPLVQGRTFTTADNAQGMPVAIVSAGFAARHLAGLDPLRESIRIGGSEPVVWRQIVGVVGDVRQVSLEEGDVNGVYVPESQWMFADYQQSLVVRSSADAASLTSSVRNAIWSVNKDQPIIRVATAESLLAKTAAARRFALVLFELFALVALVLAAGGIYGVLIGSVTDRTRELGVRSAFGASARDLVWMVVRQGMSLTLVGVGAGIALALVATRMMTTMLFGVSAVDPLTYAAVTGGLIVIALAACAWPAYRASRVDPAEALRAE
jgi:putative ABC transport system permease protein